MNVQLRTRKRNEALFQEGCELGLSVFLAHLLACRTPQKTVKLQPIIHPSLRYLDHPRLLKDVDSAALRVIQAIGEGHRIGIVTDYDVDGICSHVVLYEALHDYFGVPSSCLKSYIGHRLKDGYGITEGLTNKILADDFFPDLIVSADCGSSDEERICQLRQAGIDVIVTDHHTIPAAGIPVSALATVNPRRGDCAYPDKAIAGCMVSWLLMCYVRNMLVEQGRLPHEAPKLMALLDCVALGTVADAVSLCSPTNRAVINAGLSIMNRLARPCWRAMFKLLGRTTEPFTAQDLGFQIGPRINARSRMADPYAALRFVLSHDLQTAELCLSTLDHNNRERKQTELEMLRIAKEQAHSALAVSKATIVVADERFHAGVQGIVASRLAEAFGRPAIVFSPAANPEHLTGSARTIDSVHIQKVLQAVATRHPDLFIAFGGHRGAAGLSIYRDRLPCFRQAFETAVQSRVKPEELGPVIWTDGLLNASRISMDTLHEIERLEPFGRGFEEPVFEGCFEIGNLRRVGADSIHLSMELVSADRQSFKAIWFRAVESGDAPLPVNTGEMVRCAYRLNKNRFRGNVLLQLIVLYACSLEISR
jgi:single-stranded-DNA-specific exonuclease